MPVARSDYHPMSASASGHFSKEEIQRQIEKISASEMFVNSARMKRFLNFVVEYSLDGRSDELKEYLIGVEVFDRSGFDPRLDPIVRVEARRLREKLKRYYETIGADDELVIEFPKGSYAPQFRSRGPSPKPESFTASEPQSDSIAVLPFRNLAPESDNEYFSDGLTEELIYLLTRVPGLRVVAWNSAAQLKNQQRDLGWIREQLGVDTILCGSVRRSGEQLRITAQMIDTRDGHYLWSEVYERRLHDIFAIEEEIARAIVNTLQANLWREHLPRVTRSKEGNLDSHNLYLLGRFHLNRRTPEGLNKSVECFERAIALDPANAHAHAGLADTYCLMGDYGVRSPADCVPLTRAAAGRALELDPMLAEAYAALASIRSLHDWEWADGERLYRKSIDLNPGYATAHQWFGIDYLALRGRMAEALEEIETAHRLDPLSAIVLEGRGYLSLLNREFERAIYWYQQVLELDPFFCNVFASLGRALSLLGRFDEAIEMFQKALSFGGRVPNMIAALGQTYALSGLEAEARRSLAELEDLARRRYISSTCFAVVHVGLGEYELALGWLERGAERRDLPLARLHIHPVYDDIRSQPRFQALLRRMGFPP